MSWRQICHDEDSPNLLYSLGTQVKYGSIVSCHNLCLTVNIRKFLWNSPKPLKILSDLNGTMRPGMNAIMGPTGCGKSSFLDVLAGRKNPILLSGDVLMDGQLQPARVRRRLCGYVVQNNMTIGTLTVRENIAFSAALRLPAKLSSRSRKEKINNVLHQLGLEDVADHLVGTEHIRGVSGGERKRTSIGVELVKDPLVLYLDEPTTGLDAHTAETVMQLLKRLADAGRTIVFSIHQPKYSIYRLFDSLTLLCQGRIAYHGPCGQAPINYFHRYGYIIEGFNNPADFILDVIHGEHGCTSSDATENEDTDLVHANTTRREHGKYFLDLWEQFGLDEIHPSSTHPMEGISDPQLSPKSRKSIQNTLFRSLPSICDEADASNIGNQFPPIDRLYSWSVVGSKEVTILPRRPWAQVPSQSHDVVDLPPVGCKHKSTDMEFSHMIDSIQPHAPLTPASSRPYMASYCRQFFFLISRQYLSLIRDAKTLLTHFILQLLIAVILGVIYYDLDHSTESGIQNRMGLFFFTCIQLMFISNSMLESFIHDRVIFRHETSSGFYQVSVYFFSKILSEVITVKALPAFTSLPITYFMAGLRREILPIFFWQITVALLTVTASVVAFSISTMVDDYRMGATLLSMFCVLMMITSGYMINIISLGKWLSWFRYLSIVRLAMNVLMINEFVGMWFCTSTPSMQTLWSDTSPLSIQQIGNMSKVNVNRSVHVPNTSLETCILGDHYLEMQSITFATYWDIWQNELGILVILILALINAYLFLRYTPKYC